MDKRYETYCMADPVFFEAPGRSGEADGAAEAGEYAVARRPAPAGWRAHRGDLWLELHPEGEPMVDQGWKVHASGVAENAERVIEIVWEFCVGRRYAFKFLPSRRAFLGQNAKYAPRGSSGKLVTIYPRDEQELGDVLKGLSALLEGEPGPYILSDVRYGSGPLYARYGGFRKREILLDSGDVVPAMRGADGELVPDLRKPVFEVPGWVTPPEVLRESIAARTTPSGPPDAFPYQVEKPLHFSNGGGIYLASRSQDGLRVVLKEARPHAALDAAGSDAVTRLLRERDILRKLDGVRGIPRLHDHFTAGDHHFLAIEYIEGERLSAKEAQTYPLLGADPTAEDKAAYTAWAVDACEQVEAILDEIHGRGIVYGDVHPHNVLLRADGRAVLIDFETSSNDPEGFRQALAAPGFAAPPDMRGAEIDKFALAVLRLWLFMPLVSVLCLDQAKAHDLLAAVRENFPVPDSYMAAIRTALGMSLPETKAVRAGVGRPRIPIEGVDGTATDWPALLDSLAAAITASATPDRLDRLFPGDVRQFSHAGETFAFGASGVLHALVECGYEVPDGSAEWLLAAVDRSGATHPGFFDGTHGVAQVLDRLGRRKEALRLLEHTDPALDRLQNPNLFSGLSGIGLNLAHFAEVTGDTAFRARSLGLAERVADTVSRGVFPTASSSALGGLGPVRAAAGPAGLMHGWSGPALFLLRTYEATGDTAWLDAAVEAAHRDLDRCRVSTFGTLNVDEGWRLNPYLEGGSSGVALVGAELLAHRADSRLADSMEAARNACASEFFALPALWTGRVGQLAVLQRIADPADPVAAAQVRRHLGRLSWHLLGLRGESVFPGFQLMRISMDHATGNAGILLGLKSVLSGTVGFLPFLRPTARTV
ncbi:class III lanthionine synthetase LanKC [Streptomyces scabiei]|uniref:class III lanthionine synthetase LanKC n=1 Tax=Streptomyces scabiei TaxID=1930 RepID=UPI0029ADBBAE|nr:class III lanthionine synthetase LanKC [Streptomyces scabiei]MDX3522128.1 class III lanthionine synthetase LanKC [Streptomyces scabiei]